MLPKALLRHTYPTYKELWTATGPPQSANYQVVSSFANTTLSRSQ